MNDIEMRRFKRIDIAKPNIGHGKYLLRHGLPLYDISPNAQAVAVSTQFWCSILNGPCSTMSEAEETEATLRARIKELEQEITRLREGLGFYANLDNYKLSESLYGQRLSKIDLDEGTTARSLLGEVE